MKSDKSIALPWDNTLLIRTILQERLGWKYYKITRNTTTPSTIGVSADFEEYIPNAKDLTYWYEDKDKSKKTIALSVSRTNNPSETYIVQIDEDEYLTLKKNAIKDLEGNFYHFLEPNKELKFSYNPYHTKEIEKKFNQVMKDAGWRYCGIGKLGIFGDFRSIIKNIKLVNYHSISLRLNQNGRVNKVVLEGEEGTAKRNIYRYNLYLSYMSKSFFESKKQESLEEGIPLEDGVYRFKDSK